MTKRELTINLITEMPLYFSYKDLRYRINAKTAIEDSTLQTYLSREVTAGHLTSAGKGWYSKLKRNFVLDTNPLENVLAVLTKAFPLLECSCWTTEQINAFTHHMLGKHVLFVYVDSEAASSVHEVLLDHNYNSYLNPNKTVIEKTFRITGKTLIVRPDVARQPKSFYGASPIEKILVDLLFENRKLDIMQSDEISLVIENAMKDGAIIIASVLSYMKQREITIESAIKDFRIFQNPEILDCEPLLEK